MKKAWLQSRRLASSQRAYVGAVLQEVESVVQMGTGVGVFAVVRVEPALDLIELAKDAVLLAFEDRQRDGVRIVCLEQPVLLVLQLVAVSGEVRKFICLRGHEAVELVV